MPLGWALAAVPILIACNAFFVAAEYAVVAARAATIDSMRRHGRLRSAAAIEQLQSRPASAIGTIQICITMTNLLLGWIGEPAMSAILYLLFASVIVLLPPALVTWVATILSFLIVTLLTVVLSELLPKALTLRYADIAAWLTAVPVLGIQRLLRPMVWLMNGMADLVIRPLGLGRVEDLEKQQVTADELRLLATMAGEQGALTLRERALVLNSLAFGRRSAREIMVPRVRIKYLDLQWNMEENRRIINEQLHSRLPLCDGGMDHVVGVVHTKEFLSAYNAAAETGVLQLIARKPTFVPSSISLDRLLGVFHESHTQLVFLVDEYGGVDGLVTLQDVVDELVGEIAEAQPRLPPFTAVGTRFTPSRNP
jgi:CBS domain containing-hemolysin-like protein